MFQKLFAIGILLVLLCSCSDKTQNGSSITIAYRSLVSSLDPIQESTIISNTIYSNIFEPLVQRDKNLKIVPALALEWSSPDDRTWIFKLRPDVHFHDGALLRPQDVRFSLERAQKDPSSQLSASVIMIEKVEVAGSDSVRITTKKPSSILLNRLVEIWILPEKFFASKHSPSDAAPGTGPYRVKEWKKQEFLSLERNDQYWGEKPAVSRVRFETVSDLQQRIQGLAKNKIDMLPLLEPSALENHQIRGNEKINVQSLPSLMVLYLAMDVSREKSPYVDLPVNPFLDIRVRKAFYQAINIQEIVNGIMKGHASAATQLVAPKVLGHNDQIQRLPYDPNGAKDLLQQAGYPEGFRVRFDITNDRYQNDVEIGKAIVRDLAAIGIQVELNPLDKNALLKKRDLQDTSFYMAGWLDGSADAASAFDFLVHSRDASHHYGTANGGGYSNPEADRLIELSAEEMTPSKRIVLLERAMELTMKDSALIPLHIEHNITASSSRLQWEPRSDELLLASTIRVMSYE